MAPASVSDVQASRRHNSLHLHAPPLYPLYQQRHRSNHSTTCSSSYSGNIKQAASPSSIFSDFSEDPSTANDEEEVVNQIHTGQEAESFSRWQNEYFASSSMPYNAGSSSTQQDRPASVKLDPASSQLDTKQTTRPQAMNVWGESRAASERGTTAGSSFKGGMDGNTTCTAMQESRPIEPISKDTCSCANAESRVTIAQLEANQQDPPVHSDHELHAHLGTAENDIHLHTSTLKANQQPLLHSERNHRISAHHPGLSLSSPTDLATHPVLSTLFDRRQQMQNKRSSFTIQDLSSTSSQHGNARDSLIGASTEGNSAESETAIYEELIPNHQRDRQSLDSLLEESYKLESSNTSTVQPRTPGPSIPRSPSTSRNASCTSGCTFLPRPPTTIKTSTVKAASPLRIITTPLPAHTECYGASEGVRLSQDKSAAGSSCTEGSMVSDNLVERSDTPSDLSTPMASPSSSLFTGRSFNSSSVPTTASTSYPTSASYLPSSCNSALSDGNSLQLNQQQEQQRQQQYTDASADERNVQVKRNNSRARKSRYADYASPNIGISDNFNSPKGSFNPNGRNYDWFNQTISSTRPPLLRSVSEDTPISSNLHARTPSAYEMRQLRYAMGQYSIQEDDRRDSGTRCDSLPMGQRAMTTPIFTAAEAVQPNLASAPPSEASSRKASNSISSSYSSVSTAASSKRSSWCSPPENVAGLPLTVPQSGGAALVRANPVPSDVDTTLSNHTFKARHSASYSVNAAGPLSRAPQGHYQATKGSNAPSPMTNSAPSSVLGQDDNAGDLNSNSLLASFDPAVAEAIRKAAAAVRSHSSAAARDQGEPGRAPGARESVHVAHANMSSMQNSLMGACGNGYFGNAIRAKALEILDTLLPSTVTVVEREEVVGIAEYGSLNSLSSSLIPPITSHFLYSDQLDESSDSTSFTLTYSDGPGSDFRALMRQVDTASPHQYPFHQLNPPIYSSFTARPFPAQVVPPKSISVGISLMDLHCRRTPASSGMSAAAAAHNELQAFLNTRAMEMKKGGLLLLAFIQRQEDDSVAAVAAGRSKRAGDQESPDEPNFTSPIYDNMRDLHSSLSRTGNKNHTFSIHLTGLTPMPFPPTSQASSLSSSLNSTSTSVDSGTSTPSSLTSSASSASCGMSRRRSESSPCRPCFKTDAAVRRTDIWSTIPALLAPCIQRLVSTGLIKSDTASHLLTLPVYPRTPEQTKAVLRAVQHQWRTEWSCGLSGPAMESPGAASPSTPTPASSFAHYGSMPESLHERLDAASAHRTSPSNLQEPITEEALMLSHPAYTAFQSTTLSRIQFAEHAIQFIRVLYEAHFRSVLRDHAKLSRSRLEEVLDALNEVLREKIEEPGRAPLALELEVCMVALRRV